MTDLNKHLQDFIDMLVDDPGRDVKKIFKEQKIYTIDLVSKIEEKYY